MRQWNVRYVLFAHNRGRSPEEQLSHDKESGAMMMDFMDWIRSGVGAFKRARPDCVMGDHIADQEAFTDFLRSWQGE